ncbi:MAG: NAD(P)/FAD-dependent oxidoreductase, partial [Chitinophagaceae bacterium]
LAEEDSFTEGTDIIVPRLESLEKDITIAEFFKKFFIDPLYENLISEVRGYVEGYDAGDINRASAFALLKEWGSGEEGMQYRPVDGYGPMIEFLEKEIEKNNGKIQLETVIDKITWNKDLITAHTGNSDFSASLIILTIPLGILQSENSGAGIMLPDLPALYKNALQQLGYGSVIKIVFEFETAVWEKTIVENADGKNLANLGWLFSKERIPTWWTQAPAKIPMITGWLAGPNALALAQTDDSGIIEIGISSLANILKLEPLALQKKLVASEVFNWTADPYTAGAYAFSTPGTSAALAVLKNPVEERLYFAGEAFHDGPQMGTVEGALASGVETAKLILK